MEMATINLIRNLSSEDYLSDLKPLKLRTTFTVNINSNNYQKQTCLYPTSSSLQLESAACEHYLSTSYLHLPVLNKSKLINKSVEKSLKEKKIVSNTNNSSNKSFLVSNLIGNKVFSSKTNQLNSIQPDSKHSSVKSLSSSSSASSLSIANEKTQPLLTDLGFKHNNLRIEKFQTKKANLFVQKKKSNSDVYFLRLEGEKGYLEGSKSQIGINLNYEYESGSNCSSTRSQQTLKHEFSK